MRCTLSCPIVSRNPAWIFIVLLTLVFASCSATLPIAYAPSNLVTGTGSVFVDRFHFSAARKGNVPPNQPEKNPSGLGNIYLAEDIETVFTDAVKKELRFSGYKLAENAPVSISGTIDRFLELTGHEVIVLDVPASGRERC